jgi:imidazoleglycerol-phosphate dehydratase
MTLHINLLYGKNSHHMVEAVFKGFGRALREAVSFDPQSSRVPSTKGVL